MVRETAMQRGRKDLQVELANDWTKELDAAFERKFGIQVSTMWDVLAERYVTQCDVTDLDAGHFEWIDGFSTAVLWAANKQ